MKRGSAAEGRESAGPMTGLALELIHARDLPAVAETLSRWLSRILPEGGRAILVSAPDEKGALEGWILGEGEVAAVSAKPSGREAGPIPTVFPSAAVLAEQRAEGGYTILPLDETGEPFPCLLLAFGNPSGAAPSEALRADALAALLALTLGRIRIESVLSVGKRDWEKAFDASSDLFVLHDDWGRVFRVNMAVSLFLGLPIPACIGRSCADILPGLCQAQDVSGLEWVDAGSGRSFIASTQHINLGGQSACLHVLHEVTQERRAQALAKQQRDLELTRKMLQGLAHEIRNPLFGISSVAQALEANLSSDAAAKAYLAIILREVKRLDRLVRRFMQLAFPTDLGQSGTVEMEAILRRAIEVTGERRPELDTKRIRLHCEPGLPALQGDGEPLAQGLADLFENALFFGPVGSPVTVRAFRSEDKTLVSIEDSGPGIPEERLDLIFEPFFTTVPHRTGLGLSLARSAVLQYGGTLSVRSAPPSPGATFLIALPSGMARGKEK